MIALGIVIGVILGSLAVYGNQQKTSQEAAEAAIPKIQSTYTLSGQWEK